MFLENLVFRKVVIHRDYTFKVIEIIFITVFCVEICRSCESAGREKFYFSLNSVHKCIYGGKDGGNVGRNSI